MNVFEFDDYRALLKTHIKDRPAEGRGELKNMAESLGVNQTLLSQILSGARNFTQEQAYYLSRHLGLSDIEQEYLLTLIQMERASTAEYKQHLQDKLGELKRKEQNISRRSEDKKISPQTQTIFNSSWVYAAVRAFTAIPLGVTLSDVEDRFLLSTAQAQEVLRFLCDNGLCTEHLGRYKINEIKMNLEPKSPHLRLRALDKSSHASQEEIMHSQLLPLSRHDFLALRQQILELIKEVSNSSPPEDVACLNLDFFWLE